MLAETVAIWRPRSLGTVAYIAPVATTRPRFSAWDENTLSASSAARTQL